MSTSDESDSSPRLREKLPGQARRAASKGKDAASKGKDVASKSKDALIKGYDKTRKYVTQEEAWSQTESVVEDLVSVVRMQHAMVLDLIDRVEHLEGIVTLAGKQSE